MDQLFSSNMICTFLNPVSYLDAVKNENDFEPFDCIYADGSLLTLMIRLVYGKKLVRRSFDMTSMAKVVFDYASENKKSIYFVGTTDENIKYSVPKIREDYPHLNVIGYRNGFFSSTDEEIASINEINRVKPDILVVGMGILRQERFLLKVKESEFSGVAFSCGGFLHQYAINGKQYYPSWIDRFNLRFVYRMYKEPYTMKRYAKAFFLFPICFLSRKYRKY